MQVYCTAANMICINLDIKTRDFRVYITIKHYYYRTTVYSKPQK